MIDEHEITTESLVGSNIPVSNDITPKKPRKQRKAKIKLKARTLEEFKNWLEGLEEFQDSDWIPNSEQWSTIRSSIDLIKEEEYYDEPVVQYATQHAQQPVHNQQIVNSVPAPVQSEPLSSQQIDDMVNKAKSISSMNPVTATATTTPTGTGDEFI